MIAALLFGVLTVLSPQSGMQVLIWRDPPLKSEWVTVVPCVPSMKPGTLCLWNPEPEGLPRWETLLPCSPDMKPGVMCLWTPLVLTGVPPTPVLTPTPAK